MLYHETRCRPYEPLVVYVIKLTKKKSGLSNLNPKQENGVCQNIHYGVGILKKKNTSMNPFFLLIHVILTEPSWP